MQLKIEMKEEAVNKVLEVLAERPFKEVASIIGSIVSQTGAQVRAAEAEQQAARAKAEADAAEVAALRAKAGGE